LPIIDFTGALNLPWPLTVKKERKKNCNEYQLEMIARSKINLLIFSNFVNLMFYKLKNLVLMDNLF